jgi:hypothetical protein
MLLSVLTHAYFTFVLVSIVTALIVFVRGTETVTSFRDLRPPIGLDLLVPGATGFLGAFLNAINPFSIWGVWLTGVGVAVTHRISRGTGAVLRWRSDRGVDLRCCRVCRNVGDGGTGTRPCPRPHPSSDCRPRSRPPASSSAAWAAARRAIGTRNGEQET